MNNLLSVFHGKHSLHVDYFDNAATNTKIMLRLVKPFCNLASLLLSKSKLINHRCVC